METSLGSNGTPTGSTVGVKAAKMSSTQIKQFGTKKHPQKTSEICCEVNPTCSPIIISPSLPPPSQHWHPIELSPPVNALSLLLWASSFFSKKCQLTWTSKSSQPPTPPWPNYLQIHLGGWRIHQWLLFEKVCWHIPLPKALRIFWNAKQ